MLLALTFGCTSPRLHKPSSVLHRDLERLVTLTAARGWTIDRVEHEDMLPAALLSLCKVPVPARNELLSQLNAQLLKLGGPAKAAFVRHNRDLEAIEDVLLVERVRDLLQRAMATAAADCPFWLEPTPGFRGRQILDDRWILSVGGGGKGMFVHQSGRSDLSFGGSGRLMAGYAYGPNATFLLGLDLGASATFPRNDEGKRDNLTLAGDLVVPIAYRHRRVNSYWEGEIGYLVHATEAKPDLLLHGIHVGIAFGGATSRRRWLFPGAVLGVSYEHLFANNAHLVKLGFRVAIDIAGQ